MKKSTPASRLRAALDAHDRPTIELSRRDAEAIHARLLPLEKLVEMIERPHPQRLIHHHNLGQGRAGCGALILKGPFDIRDVTCERCIHAYERSLERRRKRAAK